MTRKYFSEKEIEKLKEIGAVEHFETAVKHQYKLGTPVEMNNLVADLYEKVTGQKLSRNWSCGHCGFNAYKKAGELYFKSLEYRKME